MASPIQQLLTLCKHTLTKHSLDKMSKEILTPIISSINKITPNDIGFNPDRYRDDESMKRDPAPVSYMELYRDNNFIMAVFVVKAGSSLPLHDHCGMFGLLKLIHGSIKLISYNDSESDADIKHKANSASPVRPVTKNPDKVISAQDACCVLTPTDGNMHEIHPLSEFSAFLDILTPPYSDSRSCNYWKEVDMPTIAKNSSSPNLRWLSKIAEPSTYWCDCLQYKGPKLT